MDNDAAFTMMRDAIDDPSFLSRVRANLGEVLKERGFSKEGDRLEMKRMMDALTACSVDSRAVPANHEYHAMLDRQLKTTFETADTFKKD